MAKNKQTDTGLVAAQAMAITLFPDAAERERLVGLALSKLGDGKSSRVPVADIVIEMLAIRRSRRLVQLVVALAPNRPEGVSALLGGASTASLDEIAYVFGVAESTAERWLAEGMPVRSI